MSDTLRIQHDSFHDLMGDQLRAAPWILVSALMHALLAMLFFLFAVDEEVVVPDPPLEAVIEDVTEEDEPIEKVEPDHQIDNVAPDIDDPDPEPHPDPDPDPNPNPNPEPDAAEVWTDNDAPVDNQSDLDLDQTAAASPIGVGGSTGGHFGRRRGGGGGRDGDGGGGGLNLARDRALDWLARHQHRDGFWDADGFMDEGDRTLGPLATGPGNALHDVGVTGLAMLAFLGAGETHVSGPYRRNLARALKWLRKRQDADGCFAIRTSERFTYDQAVATLAMVEAYGLTKSPSLRAPARRALAFCLACQNPYGGWRYGERDGEIDSSVTGWMIMALKSGRMAGLAIDEQAIAWGVSALEKLTDEDTGRCGYVKRGSGVVREPGLTEAFPAAESEALTAVAMLARIFGGHDPAEDRLIKSGAGLISECLPDWDTGRGSVDMYYWYHGSLAAFQVGGRVWRSWRRAMEDAVLSSQRGLGPNGTSDNFTGSWDPVGPWGGVGGRVYSTALMTLCLEVYYRYGRVFGAR